LCQQSAQTEQVLCGALLPSAIVRFVARAQLRRVAAAALNPIGKRRRTVTTTKQK
jgi:hypothetical protein